MFIVVILGPLVIEILLQWKFVPVAKQKNNSNQVELINQETNNTFTTKTTSVKGAITSRNIDFRAVVLNKFFERNKSPLQGYGENFIQACEKYNAPSDCTTIPAIAFVETHMCKSPLSDAQKNCWGYGGSGENRIWFGSYEQSIDTITKNLMQYYGEENLQDPKKMQYYYCGSHCDNWGDAVNSVRNDISELSQELGYPKLY